MNKAQRELIKKAIRYNGEPIDSLFIISKDRPYDGFWGENGYNEIIIIAYSRKTEKYYKWNLYERDVITSYSKLRFNIDIPSEYNCVRLFFDESITLETMQLSSFIIHVEEVKDDRD